MDLILREAGFDRQDEFVRQVRASRLDRQLPDIVRKGDIRRLEKAWGEYSAAVWGPFWLLHLLLGTPGKESLAEFGRYYSKVIIDAPWLGNMFDYFATMCAPTIGLLVDSVISGDRWQKQRARDVALRFCGIEGMGAWADLWRVLQDSLREVREGDWRAVGLFGPAVLEADREEAVRSRLAEVAGGAIPDPLIVAAWQFSYFAERGPQSGLSPEQVDRIATHIFRGSYGSDTGWMAHRLASLAPKDSECIGPLQRLLDYLMQRIGDAFSGQAAVSLLCKLYAMGDESHIESMARTLASVSREGKTIRLWEGVIGRQDQKGMLKRLGPVATSEDLDASVGACMLIRAICSPRGSTQHENMRTLSFREVPSLRQRLFTKSEILSRSAAVALYLVRPPVRMGEYEELQHQLLSCQSTEEAGAWEQTLGIMAESASQDSASMLIGSLTDVLGKDLWPGLRAFCVEMLGVLQGKLDSSLRAVEADLELPLPSGTAGPRLAGQAG
jgi:hypothetical protein